MLSLGQVPDFRDLLILPEHKQFFLFRKFTLNKTSIGDFNLAKYVFYVQLRQKNN